MKIWPWTGWSHIVAVAVLFLALLFLLYTLLGLDIFETWG